jgi:hypothetical protein
MIAVGCLASGGISSWVLPQSFAGEPQKEAGNIIRLDRDQDLNQLPSGSSG